MLNIHVYIYILILLLLLFNLGLLPTVAVSVRAFDQLLDIYGFSPASGKSLDVQKD